MSSIVARPQPTLQLKPSAAGVVLTANEFDCADVEPGWRYELIQGVLVVSPATSPAEQSPNEELGYLLRHYRDYHSHGAMLDETLPEHEIHVGDQRRRADRVIWAGLGRRPEIDETPTIAVEFVSEGKRNLKRDYEVKRRENQAIGIREYWVIDRFERMMTVYRLDGTETTVVEGDGYRCELLPGFELGISSLLAAADRWNRSAD